MRFFCKLEYQAAKDRLCALFAEHFRAERLVLQVTLGMCPLQKSKLFTCFLRFFGWKNRTCFTHLKIIQSGETIHRLKRSPRPGMASSDLSACWAECHRSGFYCPEFCCQPEDGLGNPSCWDEFGTYTFSKCCSESQFTDEPQYFQIGQLSLQLLGGKPLFFLSFWKVFSPETGKLDLIWPQMSSEGYIEDLRTITRPRWTKGLWKWLWACGICAAVWRMELCRLRLEMCSATIGQRTNNLKLVTGTGVKDVLFQYIWSQFCQVLSQCQVTLFFESIFWKKFFFFFFLTPGILPQHQILRSWKLPAVAFGGFRFQWTRRHGLVLPRHTGPQHFHRGACGSR